MGMKKRKAILGDDGPSDPKRWDKVWAEDVHVAMAINGQTIEYVEESYQWVISQIDMSDGRPLDRASRR
jgi:hypothetical protein